MQGKFIGKIEFGGHSASAGGCFVGGWIGTPWQTHAERDVVNLGLILQGQEARVVAIPVTFEREELRQQGAGIVLFIPSPDDLIAGLQAIELRAGEFTGRFDVVKNLTRIDADALPSRLGAALNSAKPASNAQALRARLVSDVPPRAQAAPPASTLMMFGIDEAICCTSGEIVLAGWCVAPGGPPRAMRLLSGGRSVLLSDANIFRFDRPDIMTIAGLGYGYQRCGLLIIVAAHEAREGPLLLEVEDSAGAILRKPLSPAPSIGNETVKAVLRRIVVRPEDYAERFGAVIGPALAALHAPAAAKAAAPERLALGPPPASPECALIVPLYGQIDLMEVQLALFSADPFMRACEIIYVLDQPEKAAEAQGLARSVHARLDLPFQLLTLPTNRGFSGASNAGLEAATAPVICFINSDVLPVTPGWLPALSASLQSDPAIGVVGPLLLFEDGSIQHDGMAYGSLAEFGGWMFPLHPRKGRRPGAATGLHDHPAITGACMVLRRRLAEALGGFDESYIIGDFEDSDLCQRIAARGLRCVVDRDVRMTHLERMSQAGGEEPWRRTLTAYNAWLHQSRWFALPTNPSIATPIRPTASPAAKPLPARRRQAV